MSTLPKSIERRFADVNVSITRIVSQCGNNVSAQCEDELTKYHKILLCIMNDIKEILKIQSIGHEFMLMEVSFILSLIALCICISLVISGMGINISVPGFLLIVSFLCLLMSALLFENFNDQLFSAFKLSFFIIIFILTGHTLRGVVSSIRSVITLRLEYQRSETMVTLTLFINILSLAFPSLIKEEHQVWFNLSTTLALLYLVQEVIQKILIKNQSFELKSTYLAALSILILDRLLRGLNRTGEKWLSASDVGDFVNRSENVVYLIIMIGVCLPLVGILIWRNDSLFFSIVAQLMIVLNGVHRLADVKEDRALSDISAWMYYALILLQLGCLIVLKSCFGIGRILRFSIIIFLVSFLVCRHQNIVLWTAIALKTMAMRYIWNENIQHYNIAVQFIIFNILGMTSFYQQGNSNSLTTIDVLPGFVGMPEYIAFIVNPLVTVQMYAGNLYWILLWLEWLAETQPDSKNTRITVPASDEGESCATSTSPTPLPRDPLLPKIVLSLTILSLIYTLSIFLFSLIHKHNIIAWSVYSPKLMNHAFQYGITFILYIFIATFNFL